MGTFTRSTEVGKKSQALRHLRLLQSEFAGARVEAVSLQERVTRWASGYLGFQILTSLLEPDSRRESSLDKATVRMSERCPGASKPCSMLTSSSFRLHTCANHFRVSSSQYATMVDIASNSWKVVSEWEDHAWLLTNDESEGYCEQSPSCTKP